jgi:hypothetical protein
MAEGDRWRRARALVVAGVLLASASPARAGGFEDAGWGIATVFTNVLYMPAKIVYATVGAVTGGLTWCVTGGDTETANKVWVPTLEGTYVVTPPMLRGEEPINFVGGPPLGTVSDAQRLTEQPLGGS